MDGLFVAGTLFLFAPFLEHIFLPRTLKRVKGNHHSDALPMGSMYGIFTYICHKETTINVGK